jgi:hypothetical protein
MRRAERGNVACQADMAGLVAPSLSEADFRLFAPEIARYRPIIAVCGYSLWWPISKFLSLWFRMAKESNIIRPPKRGDSLRTLTCHASLKPDIG